jgi:hypothetical protein
MIKRMLCLALYLAIAVLFSKTVAASEPFKMGERLIYSVEWDPPWYFFFLPKMDAGEIELILAGEIEYEGKKALKVAFKVRSSGILLKLAGVKIEDEFTFFSEPETFCSMHVSKKIREGKRKRQIEMGYLKESSQLHFRELDESQNPPKLFKDEIKNNIPACVQDPFSAVYYLRTMPLIPDYFHHITVGYDTRFREINAYVEKKETIDTPAGKFSAWKIRTASLIGGLFKGGGQFRLWLSTDDNKTPVQFDVKVPLGRVLGRLKRLP